MIFTNIENINECDHVQNGEREREANSLITDACVCCGIESMNDSTEKA